LKNIGRFFLELLVNLLFLIIFIYLFGAIENALGIFDKDEDNILLLILFFLSNLSIIYVIYRNYFVRIFPFKYSSQSKLSKTKTRTFIVLPILVFITLTIYQNL